jgi:hypothetical protein
LKVLPANLAASPDPTAGSDLAKREGPLLLSDRIGSALREISGLEDDLEFLEDRLPPLLARLDAAVRPLLAEIVQTRQELIQIVERRLLAAPRRSPLHRDGTDLIAHLASDLQERFGVDIGPILRRLEPEGRDPDDDEEADDDFSWARPENHAPRRETPDPRRNRKREPVDPEAAAKGIYRSLARELHPDKTRDESERRHRTGLMQNLTQAWTDRDLPALLGLLHTHGSEQARADALGEEAFEACLEGLDETIDGLRRKIRDLRHRGTPEGVVDWMPYLRDGTLVERLERRQKAPARRELEELAHWKRLWSRPDGLERFFREVPDHLWNQMV